MVTRVLPLIAVMHLLSSASALGAIHYQHHLEISPASVKLLDQKEPDKDFSETELSQLRMLVRNIAAAHILKGIYTPRERAISAASLFREGFHYGVLANFMRQQFEKGFWPLGRECNPLKYILPGFTSLAAVVIVQTKRWFEEAPKAESTLMARLNLSKGLVLEKFEPFEHEPYALTCLLVDGCQIKARHLLHRLCNSGWFPAKGSWYNDHMFP